MDFADANLNDIYKVLENIAIALENIDEKLGKLIEK